MMRKITDFIINKRYFVLSLFIVLTIISGALSTKVKINHDISKYLPDTSETRIGMDIMEKEFSETSTLNLMFENLSSEEKDKIKDDLSHIDGVQSVSYDHTDKYNKQNYTLYVINVNSKSDSKTSANIYNEITKKYKDYTIYTSGSISESNKNVLPFWIIALAVLCALVILLIMCDSFVEPFLFLISILMAVVLNKGTNIIFENVSSITNSIAAILQMALSMDYSIMLMNRYDQEKQIQKDKIKAMKNALYKSFTAISSSSVTTIVGLLALVFMSFKIGKDLGFVLAKGVLFSLICIFFVLPVLILMFDKWIVKTKKKAPNIKLNKLGKVSYKMRFLSLPLFLLVFLISYFLKGSLGIDYTDSKADEISKIFEENNVVAIIYKNEEEEKISKYLNNLDTNDKINEVLGYGNTLNEKLTFDKLNSKLNDLGKSVQIDDYLLKIVYYDYYNKNINNQISFEDFINFITREVYNNPKANNKITEQTKKDIERLKNFITSSSMNKQRSLSDVASILSIDKDKIDDLLVYYLSLKNNLKLSITDFINFMQNDCLTNEKYASKIDDETLNNLNVLSKFSDEKLINTKMSSTQISNLFGIDNKIADELYQYYILINNIGAKLSLSEVSQFILNDVISNPKYASSFDSAKMSKIKLLENFSDLSIINKQMSLDDIAILLDIPKEKIMPVLLLKYMNAPSSSAFSLSDFINNIVIIDDTTTYLKNIDISVLRGVSIFAKNENNINEIPLDKDTLNSMFGSLKENLVNDIYALNSLADETPKDFINLVINTLEKEESAQLDDDQTLNNLKFLKMIIDDSTSSDKVLYKVESLASILNMKSEQINSLYNLIDYKNGNIDNWTISPYELVNILLTNKDRDEIKTSVDDTIIMQLQLLSKIMQSAIDDEKFSYEQLASLIGMDEESLKNVYALYTLAHTNLSMTPKEFTDFILSKSEDAMLKNQIKGDTLKQLNVLKQVINGVINHETYSYHELASLLGTSEDSLKLLYGLYDFKYVDSNLSISLKDFITFLLEEVVPNEEYARNFSAPQIVRLKTVNDIMNGALKSIKYTSHEMYTYLSKLSDNVDENMIDMLYTYYGSDNEYNENWQMTTEEFINFLNQDVLNDVKFNDFIEDDMRNDIINAKKTINDAKDLLIGKEYSRIILNTTLNMESPQTFAFIQNTKEMLEQDIDEFYIIGDSPMAYEMSKSFNNELNLITIITMIAIFIVVCVTFKSIFIPIILVLTIQTAVYLTMGILSIAGENVYFISLLIVQSILMGATIDYAILYTSYYLEYRKQENIKESIIDAYNHSIHTILTSSLILMIVTLIIACFTSDIAAKICKTISEGTLCSTILILVLLPSVLAFLDKFIIKKDKNTFKIKN